VVLPGSVDSSWWPRSCSGVSLSALDGSRHINILAFPLIGLIAWNLFVYIALLVTWTRTRGQVAAGFWSAHFYERWIAGRIESLMRHSTRYNVPLHHWVATIRG